MSSLNTYGGIAFMPANILSPHSPQTLWPDLSYYFLTRQLASCLVLYMWMADSLRVVKCGVYVLPCTVCQKVPTWWWYINYVISINSFVICIWIINKSHCINLHMYFSIPMQLILDTILLIATDGKELCSVLPSNLLEVIIADVLFTLN
jgi:hypothetical protein